MLAAVRKWFAVRSYAKQLGPKLRKEYGPRGKYTPTQVLQTIKEVGLSDAYSCYALSMFCNRGDFNDYHAFFGRHCDYDVMRTEVADRFFDGDAAFDVSDAIHIGADWESHAGSDSADADHDTGDYDSGDTGGCDSGDTSGDSSD